LKKWIEDKNDEEDFVEPKEVDENGNIIDYHIRGKGLTKKCI
jgi:hypothetical protein